MNDVLFGLNVSISAGPEADPVGDARLAERSGFDFVSVNDHPAAAGAVYEAWTLMSWIAAATERIAVAPRVLAAPLRLPAMVAKAVVSLDRLSRGRVILALGSGGSREELERLGVRGAARSKPTRALEETVRIVRGLWDGGEFSFDGEVYDVASLRLEPSPAHRIPIWLGTFGPRGLDLTGELADGWIPSLGYGPPSELPLMRRRVVDAALAAGRSEDDVRCVLNLSVHVGQGESDDPDTVSGDAAKVAEQLLGFVAMGFTGFNLIAKGGNPGAQVRALGDSVLPDVRTRVSAVAAR